MTSFLSYMTSSFLVTGKGNIFRCAIILLLLSSLLKTRRFTRWLSTAPLDADLNKVDWNGNYCQTRAHGHGLLLSNSWPPLLWRWWWKFLIGAPLVLTSCLKMNCGRIDMKWSLGHPAVALPNNVVRSQGTRLTNRGQSEQNLGMLWSHLVRSYELCGYQYTHVLQFPWCARVSLQFFKKGHWSKNPFRQKFNSIRRQIPVKR